MASKVCILCPGQGAQAVGMGKDYYEASGAAREVFEAADRVLGFSLSSICFGGPEDRLNQTDLSQPAIYVTSVASHRAAVAAGILDPGETAVCAGLSLGEYTALHLAGVFGFEEGLKLVAARGRLMQQAAVATPSGMVALMGGDEAVVRGLCEACSEGEVLVPANFNTPGQIVVSGAIGACNRVAVAAEGRGLKAIALKVAGAFHSPLMGSAAEGMRRELEGVEFMLPRCTVYANVTAAAHADAVSMKGLLVDQITHPVKWQQTMEILNGTPGLRFVELAPGRTLAGLAKKVNRRLAIESLATAEALSGGN